MNYYKLFAPPPPEEIPPATSASLGPKGDRRDGLDYLYSDDIRIKVNVALATGRPLLVSGPSGSGKSTLAHSIARFQKWRLYEFVTSSNTRARDLLYTFDTLRRLSDAEAGLIQGGTESRRELAKYIEPGVMWWALEPASAERRGLTKQYRPEIPAADPNKNPEAQHPDAVVLIDEIDKADPDVPNDLLVPFGSFEFYVPEVNYFVAPQKRRAAPPLPLIVITTNGERELPTAFLRRCLALELERAQPERLIEIAKLRFGSKPKNIPLYTQLAEMTREAQRPAGAAFARAPLPSTAEYLDAVRVCLRMKLKPNREDLNWRRVEAATLWKVREGSSLAA